MGTQGLPKDTTPIAGPLGVSQPRGLESLEAPELFYRACFSVSPRCEDARSTCGLQGPSGSGARPPSTSIWRGLAFSLFGSVTVRTPLSYFALMFFGST